MSLKAWYTFNGNYNNQGVGDLNLGVSIAPTYVNGNAGKAISTGEFTWTAAQTASVYNNQAISIAFWIYPTESSNNTGVICGNQGMGASNNRKFTLFQYPNSTSLYWSWQNDTANATFTNGVVSGCFPAKTWTHCCVTYQNPNGTIYINGVKKTTFTGVSNSSSFAYATPIIGQNSYRYLRDFRVYDNCISDKEVKELAKGLCLHYKLHPADISNLVQNSFDFSGWNIGEGWTKSTDADGSTVYSFSRTGATSNNLVRIIPAVKLTPSNYPNGVTISMDFKADDISAVNSKIIGALQIYKSNGTRIGWVEPGWDLSKVSSGVWTRISRTFPYSEITRISDGKSAASDVSYTQLSFQLVQNGSIHIKKIKCEAGTKATPWCFNPSDALYGKLYNNIESDVSGMGFNGTKVSLGLPCDSPKYNTSFSIAGGYIGYNNSPLTLLSTNHTFAFWAKVTTPANTQCIWNCRTSVGGPISVFIISSNFRYDDGASHTLSYTIPTNKWEHYVITRNSSNIKLYVNGVLKVTTTSTAFTSIGTKGTIGASSTNTATGSGNNFAGALSDFRIYATALSDADVLDLYKNSASIDNKGNLFAREFSEV